MGKKGNKQVKSVSRHRCDTSLEIYEKASDGDKIKMGMDLGNVLTKKPNQPVICQLQPPLVLSACEQTRDKF